MSEDSEDEIQFIEQIQPKGPARKRKWHAPNPSIRKGSENDLLENIRKKLHMDSSPVLQPSRTISDASKRRESQSTRGGGPSSSSTALPENTAITVHSQDRKELAANRLHGVSEQTEKNQIQGVKLSSSLLNRTSNFFGAGTSSQNAFEILKKGAKTLSKSPRKSPSAKSKRLSKNSPIRLLPRVVNSPKKSPRNSPLKIPVKMPSPRKNVCRSLIDSRDEVLSDGPYYFESFCFMLKKIQSCTSFPDLFLENECVKISEFNDSRKELQLYVRLMNRKDKWNRFKDIHYNDIASDLVPLFDILEEKELVICDISEEKLDDLLCLLNAEEIRNLCSMFRVSLGKTKGEMINGLLLMCRTQPTFGGGHPLRESVLNQLGRCVRLRSEWRHLFRRCIMLFSMFHSFENLDSLSQEQALLLLQVKLGRMVFPISTSKVQQYPQIFLNRDQFIRYEEARDIHQKFNFALDAKNEVAVEELTKKAYLQFQALLELHEETRHVQSLPDFLQKFSAGSSYAYVLTQSANEIIKKTIQKFKLAEKILRCLLKQNVYRQNYRGRWTLQLCKLLHVNLKDITEAAILCHRGLIDKTFGVVDRMLIQKRAELVLKSLRYKPLHRQLKSVIEDCHTKTVHVQIPAKLVPGSKPGLKRVYVRETAEGKEYMSVEEVVREHYRSKGFVYGVHDEGTTIASLCYLALWDVIYDTTVPFVFVSSYQDKPLDWGSKEFYQYRRNVLNNRFDDLLSKTSEAVSEELEEAYHKYLGIACVVSWSRLEHLQIKDFMKCLTVPVFVAICKRLMQDLKSNRNGFPDLILWNPNKGECLFVEVKSPNDILSTTQCLWLNFLIQNRATALVANVRDTGSKAQEILLSNQLKNKNLEA